MTSRLQKIRPLSLLLILPLFLLSTCKKDCPSTPTEPCPCTGDACIDEMMAYTYFLPGTWWVYEEQNSGLRDSVYVYEAFEGENANGFRYFTVRMHSEYDGYNYYHEFSETSSAVGITRPECQVQHLHRTKTRPGDFVGSDPAFFFPLILNDYRYVGGQGGTTSIDTLTTNLSDGEVEKVYFDIDDCNSEDYQHAGFLLKPHIGVQRKIRFDLGYDWRLINYSIVQ